MKVSTGTVVGLVFGVAMAARLYRTTPRVLVANRNRRGRRMLAMGPVGGADVEQASRGPASEVNGRQHEFVDRDPRSGPGHPQAGVSTSVL